MYALVRHERECREQVPLLSPRVRPLHCAASKTWTRTLAVWRNGLNAWIIYAREEIISGNTDALSDFSFGEGGCIRHRLLQNVQMFKMLKCCYYSGQYNVFYS